MNSLLCRLLVCLNKCLLISKSWLDILVLAAVHTMEGYTIISFSRMTPLCLCLLLPLLQEALAVMDLFFFFFSTESQNYCCLLCLKLQINGDLHRPVSV